MWALVIIAIAASDGGRAINTDLRYHTYTKCETAAKIINETKWQSNHWPPQAVCVPVGL